MSNSLRALLSLFLAVLLSESGQAQTGGSFDAASLERVWNQAHLDADTSALDALWADDITIAVPGMAPMSKAEALRMWKAMPVKFTRYESTDITARVEGNVAVVTGRIARARSFGDRSSEEQWYFTKVYRKSKSSWRVIAFHASNAPT